MDLRPLEKKALLRIKEHLDQHYTENTPVNALSDRAWSDNIRFTPSRLRKAFKKTFLQTIPEYRTHLRMEEAKSLLVNTDQSIKAIAMTIGYKGSKKFTPIFKKHFGLLPTAYRNNFTTAM